MQPAPAEVVEQVFGAVGLDDPGAERIDEVAERRIGIFEREVVVVAPAKRIPQRVVPDQRPAAQRVAHPERHGRIFGPGVEQFTGRGLQVGDVRLHQFRGIRVVEVHDRHVDHLIEVFPIQGQHLIGGFRTLHDDLARRSGPFQHRHHEVEVAVGLVEIDQHTPFGGQKGLFERRDRVFGADAAAVFEPERADRIQRPVGHLSLARGRAVQRGVVHDDQHAVAGQLKVQFNYVDPHVDRVFDGRHGVFGRMAPVAAVRHDEDCGGIPRQEAFPEPFGPVFRRFRPPGVAGTACQHGECQQAGYDSCHGLFEFMVFPDQPFAPERHATVCAVEFRGAVQPLFEGPARRRGIGVRELQDVRQQGVFRGEEFAEDIVLGQFVGRIAQDVEVDLLRHVELLGLEVRVAGVQQHEMVRIRTAVDLEDRHGHVRRAVVVVRDEGVECEVADRVVFGRLRGVCVSRPFEVVRHDGFSGFKHRIDQWQTLVVLMDVRRGVEIEVRDQFGGPAVVDVHAEAARRRLDDIAHVVEHPDMDLPRGRLPVAQTVQHPVERRIVAGQNPLAPYQRGGQPLVGIEKARKGRTRTGVGIALDRREEFAARRQVGIERRGRPQRLHRLRGGIRLRGFRCPLHPLFVAGRNSGCQRHGQKQAEEKFHGLV